jgi:hypothetical protein
MMLFFENDDYQTSFRPSLNFKHIHQNKLLGRMQKLFAHASEHHPKLLARAEKGYIYSYQRFVKYNHFNPRFDVKWKKCLWTIYAFTKTYCIHHCSSI